MPANQLAARLTDHPCILLQQQPEETSQAAMSVEPGLAARQAFDALQACDVTAARLLTGHAILSVGY
jgi:hypothetical protein